MKRLILVLVSLGLVACASSGAFHAGQSAERRGDYDRAVLEYAHAVQLDPQSVSKRESLKRARLRGSDAHLFAARRLLTRGLLKGALDEARLALDLNPEAATVRDLVHEIESRTNTAHAVASFEETKQRARQRPLAGLTPGPAASQPLGLSFSGASLREIYQALGRVVGVNFVFDAQFVDQTVNIDLRELRFEQALDALATIGQTFYRIIDEKVVTIVPDTPKKRQDYEQQVVKTFFLSNADPKETADLLRVLFSARRVAVVAGANAVTMNDTPERIAAAERVVDIIDKRRAEVVVEVEILELNRSRLQDYGIEITSGISGTSGVAGGVFPSTTVSETSTDASGNVTTTQRPITLKDNPYKAGNLLVSNLPGVIYRLLRTDSSTRLLANPQLRISDGQSAKARFGDEVPVPVTTFVPIAQGGVSTQPFTSFEYKTVGVNIDIKPRVHHDGDITLELQIEISALSGAGYQNLPTFNTRTVKSIIRLHEGETNVLAGLIRDTERRSLSGIPGLASVPILGALFAHNSTDVEQSDIVMTLTPHVVQQPALTEEDLRSFLVGSNLVNSTSAPPGGEPITSPTSAPPATPSEPSEPHVAPIRPPGPSR
jgi:general secretion pathway protein D